MAVRRFPAGSIVTGADQFVGEVSVLIAQSRAGSPLAPNAVTETSGQNNSAAIAAPNNTRMLDAALLPTRSVFLPSEPVVFCIAPSRHGR